MLAQREGRKFCPGLNGHMTDLVNPVDRPTPDQMVGYLQNLLEVAQKIGDPSDDI